MIDKIFDYEIKEYNYNLCFLIHVDIVMQL